MRYAIAIFFFLGASAMANAGENSLPSLSSVGFTSGRAATEADVKAGKAVFILKDGETSIGRAINIDLPQYAYFLDNGKKVLVVVIQAEEARGQRMMGGITSSGVPVAGFLTDFELLGTKQP
jgi:hypothetical protein